MKKTGWIALLLIVLALLSACAPTGSVTILEKDGGETIAVTFNSWSRQDTFAMALSAGDAVSVEIACESGSIGLTVTGKDGSTPYTGKALQQMTFTLNIAQTDTYVFALTGDTATGSLTVSK